MQTTSSYPKWLRYTLALAAGLFLLPAFPALHLDAQLRRKPHPAQKHKGHPAQKHTAHHVKSADKRVKRHYAHHVTRHHTTHHARHPYRSSHPRSSLRLQPARVKEIQQALARTGYLHGEATGSWDAATREAMQHFQQANGFTPTGLPEAKPLMKLGLGPHPLPPDLQPLISASADISSGGVANSSSNAGTPARLSSQAQ